MSVTWNYNGTNSLVITAVGAAGEWYSLFCGQEFTSPFAVVQADGAGAFGNTFSDIHDPGGSDDDPGARNHAFGVEVRHVTDNTGATDIAWFACNVFAYGEATTTGHKVYANWTYDGNKNVSVELATITGCDYVLHYSEFVAGVEVGGSSATFGGNGQLQTLTVTMANTPDAVNGFLNVTIEDTASPFPTEQWQIANRMMVGGSATLIEGNPETPTTVQLVAVGDNPGATSRIETSPNGIVWTLATDPDPTGTLFGVASGNGVLVACGDAGVARSTDDGATWTAHTTPFSLLSGFSFGICYSPALAMWVIGGRATGAAPPAPGSDESVIMTSTDDGITWTEQTTPWLGNTDSALVQGVAWSQSLGQFVAGGAANAGAPFPVIMTSPDGITWTSQSTPMDGGNSIAGVYFDPTLALWIAVGADGTHSIMTSPDGATWAARFNGGAGASAASNSTLALATASATFAGGAVATSPDGITWTSFPSPFDVAGAEGTDWIESLWAFAVAAPSIYLSPDGYSWWGGFDAPGGFSPQDVCALTSPTPPTKRCRDCGSGLLGTLLRL